MELKVEPDVAHHVLQGEGAESLLFREERQELMRGPRSAAGGGGGGGGTCHGVLQLDVAEQLSL